MLNIILLSGGSGKRLWPLSNDTMSKQFLRLLKNDKGEKESMVQRVFRQIEEAGIKANITIATNTLQEDLIKKQLGDINTVLEPERRNTFPAIILACANLIYKQKVSLNDSVIVLPVDPFAELDYFKTLLKIDNEIQNGDSNIVLMGIKPTYPSEKYGYIVCDKQNSEVKKVKSFKEKPNLEDAKQLLKECAYWNGGVFGFKLEYIDKIIKKYVLASSFEDVLNSYSKLPSISFDYEVVEKEKNISMVEYCGYWKDLGTWNTLTEEMSATHGNAILGEECNNVSIINVTNRPIVALGLKDTVIAASAEGIIVSSKEKSSYIKPYVDKLDSIPMYQDKNWGTYKVLDAVNISNNQKCITKHLTINNDKDTLFRVNQYDVIWNIVDGEGELTINNEKRIVKKEDSILIKSATKYKIKAISDLHIIEVQICDYLMEKDLDI